MVLMIVGIALFGLLAVSLASSFVEHHGGEQLDPQMAEIAERLERIERALEATGRKVTNMASFRSSLYGLARLIGDVNVVKKGRVGVGFGPRIAGKGTADGLGGYSDDLRGPAQRHDVGGSGRTRPRAGRLF